MPKSIGPGGGNDQELQARVDRAHARGAARTGIRIGCSLTLIGTLLGEMFASQRGLGIC